MTSSSTTTTTTHPLVDDYLRRLERAARVLPRSQRDELLDEIRSHLAAGLDDAHGEVNDANDANYGTGATDVSEADVRNLLDALGDPADIVSAAGPDRPPPRRGATEILALVLLVTGLPPVIGWLGGAVLAVSSRLWTTRQKVLAIVVWPGGWAATLLFTLGQWSRGETCDLDGTNCTSSGMPYWLAVTLAIVFVVVPPVIVAVHLYRAARRRADEL
jgi:hypothetical protein